MWKMNGAACLFCLLVSSIKLAKSEIKSEIIQGNNGINPGEMREECRIQILTI